MSIYRRGGVYWFSFQFRGERLQRSTHQSKARKAREMEAEHRTALARGETPPLDRQPVQRKPSLREIERRFLDYAAQRNKPGTLRHYEGAIRRLIAFKPLADVPIDRIDDSLVERFIQWRRASVSIATTNRELATLRRVLNLARRRWRLIESAAEVSLLPGEKGREYVLPYAEERAYLSAAPQPLRDVATVCLDTALRPGEALALEWSDLNLEPRPGARYGLLRVREGKSRASRRIVPLTGRLRAMLTERETTRNGGRLIFPGDVPGEPFRLTSLEHQHAVIRKRLRLADGFVPHSWRHTALTRLGEAGVDVWTLARIAGHSTVGLASRYVHPSDEAVERAFVKLEAADERLIAVAAPMLQKALPGPEASTAPATSAAVS